MLVYSLEAADDVIAGMVLVDDVIAGMVLVDDVIAGMVLVDVIPVMMVVLTRLMLAGPASIIKKVVVTPGAYVVTTKTYVWPD